LKGILNTHQHFDHIRGNAPLVDAFHAPVRKLKNSETVQLGEGHSLETLDTPGHTLDHQVFLWKKDSNPFALFSGDTLFNSGVGNCRNGGDVGMLFETTEKLAKLPKDTLLYPGHDYRRRNLEFALSVEPENRIVQERLKELEAVVTEELPPVTLNEEQKVNPFFRLSSDEILQNVLHDQNENRRELFIQLRKLRDNW
jgi:hydroxyacylglutathione hydrolase